MSAVANGGCHGRRVARCHGTIFFCAIIGLRLVAKREAISFALPTAADRVLICGQRGGAGLSQTQTTKQRNFEKVQQR